MKRCIWFAFSILFIFFSGNAPAKEIKVPDDFGTIQAAINAASPGDSVFLKAGTYRECIELKSGVELKGSGVSRTIIVPPEGKSTPIIMVKDAECVKISALAVDGLQQNFPSGIQIKWSEAEVQNCEVRGVHDGIYVYFSKVRITDNTVSKNDNIGIDVHYSEATITRNQITDSKNGIVCSNASPQIVISKNTIWRCECGIRVGTQQRVNTADIIIVKDNFIEEGSGSEVGISVYGKEVTRRIEGNVIKNCWYGIAGKYAKFEAKYNLFIDCGRPIDPWRSEAKIINNTFYKCRWIAITCYDAKVDVQNNIFASCKDGAIALTAGSTYQIIHNDFWDVPVLYFGDIFGQETIKDVKKLNKLKDSKDNVAFDPRFRNPEKGDFSLHPASPVKDMGAFPLMGKAVNSLNKDITTWGMMKKR